MNGATEQIVDSVIVTGYLTQVIDCARPKWLPKLGLLWGLACLWGWPNVARCGDRTSPNPLTEEEIELVGPVVEYLKSVPLQPVAGEPDEQTHNIGIYRVTGKNVKEHLLHYDGLKKGFFIRPGTAKSQQIMDFEWPQSSQAVTDKERWQAFAKLVKSLTDRYPDGVISLEDSRLYLDSATRDDSHTWHIYGYRPPVPSSRDGTPRKKRQKIEIFDWSTYRRKGHDLDSKIAFDAETLLFLGGRQLEGKQKHSMLFREHSRIGRDFRKKVVAFEVANDVVNLHLKVDRKGTYEAQEAWHRGLRARDPDWKRVSEVNLGDANWSDSVDSYFKRVEQAYQSRVQSQKDAELERARELAHELGGVPNREVVRLMDEILAKSPLGTELTVAAKLLHQGYREPVTFYAGDKIGGKVAIDGYDGQDRVKLLPPDRQGKTTPAWSSLEELRFYLARLAKAAGEDANVHVDVWGEPIFGQVHFEATDAEKGKIEVSGGHGGLIAPRTVTLLEDNALFDANLKIIGGDISSERGIGEEIGVESRYERTGEIADRMVETRWILREKPAYEGDIYARLVDVGVFKVNEEGAYLATRLTKEGEPTRWKMVRRRSQGAPFGLDDRGMDLLDKFKAGRLPRPHTMKKSARRSGRGGSK